MMRPELLARSNKLSNRSSIDCYNQIFKTHTQTSTDRQYNIRPLAAAA
jgi:hypothetical protein